VPVSDEELYRLMMGARLGVVTSISSGDVLAEDLD
jgi:hypothetical protein